MRSVEDFPVHELVQRDLRVDMRRVDDAKRTL